MSAIKKMIKWFTRKKSSKGFNFNMDEEAYYDLLSQVERGDY